MKRFSVAIGILLGLLFSISPGPARTGETGKSVGLSVLEAAAACPDCSGTAVEVKNTTFYKDDVCECFGSESMTIGPGVTVQAGATVTFKAPTVTIGVGNTFEPGATINIRQFQIGAITLTATPNSVAASATNYSTIQIEAEDTFGQPVPKGTAITLTTTLGTFSNGLATSTITMPDITGVTTTFLFVGTTQGTATVTATSGGVTAAPVTVTVTGPTVDPASVTVAAVPAELPGNGVDKSEIRATVKDDKGSYVPDGVTVNFSVVSGSGVLSANSATTVSGVATVNLTSGSAGSVVVKATVSQGQVSGEVTVIFTRVPGSLSLSTSQTSVKTDNSDSATITATVLDTSNVPYPGLPVTFSVPDGQLSASSVTTDSKGEAKVEFSCGPAYKANRQVTITVRVSGLPEKEIPIQIEGTTINLSTDNTNLELGSADSETATLNITLKDAGASPIYDVDVTISIDPSSTGSADLSKTSGKTDVLGQVSVDVTGTGAGDVVVKVESLGTTNSQKFTVADVLNSFGIIQPTERPYNLELNDTVEIVVKAPTQSKVIFATTLGSWFGTGGLSVVTKDVDPLTKQASAELIGNNAGTATVQVYDKDNVNTTTSMKVNIYLPISSAAQISLQASSTVVAPSTETLFNSVILYARVRDANDQIVPDVPVSFRIVNSTGGGEYISPPLSYTKMSNGIAESTFTSGSMSSSSNGIEVEASVVDKALADSTRIVIGGTAGSVVIGQSTSIESINNDTSYKLPMSVQAVDSNGNPVPGAVISLQLWPKMYRTGRWIPQSLTSQADCVPGEIESYNNEDDYYKDYPYPQHTYYRNLILNPGEDLNGDGQLTPSSSSAGSVPPQVVAEDTGVANFYLTFPKSSAAWIQAELTGSTFVLGSETRSTKVFILPWSTEDADKCLLEDSPYNTLVPEYDIESLTATPDKMRPDVENASSIRAYVTQGGAPVADGTEVAFIIVSGSGAFNQPFPIGKIETTSTTTGGQTSVVYYAGEIPGLVTIRAQLADGTNEEKQLITLTDGPGYPFTIEMSYEVAGDGTYIIRANVKDDESLPVIDGLEISFAITQGTGTFPGPVREYTGLTVSGQVSVVYTPALVTETVKILATAENGADSAPLTFSAP